MVITIRSLDLPNDYPAIARLLNMLRQEPNLTAAQLEEEDRNIPGANNTSLNEQGLLTGFARERVVAVDEQGSVIGYAASWRVPWAEPGNLASTLVVDPEHRQRGIGTALLQHLETWGRELNASHLLSELPDHLPQSRAFVEKRGYAIERHMFQSTLELATFDPTRLAGVVEAAGQAGVAFVALSEYLETNARDAIHDLFARTYLDNPAADVIPPMADIEEHFASSDPLLIWVALADGKPVGMTQLVQQPSGGLYNEYTGVDPAYRGRKIALALKLIAIEKAQELGAPYMRTDNDAENHPMLAINRKLGYEPAPGHYRIGKPL